MEKVVPNPPDRLPSVPDKAADYNEANGVPPKTVDIQRNPEGAYPPSKGPDSQSGPQQ